MRYPRWSLIFRAMLSYFLALCIRPTTPFILPDVYANKSEIGKGLSVCLVQRDKCHHALMAPKVVDRVIIGCCSFGEFQES